MDFSIPQHKFANIVPVLTINISSFQTEYARTRGGTNQSSARLELGLDAKKALILGSKLGSGSKGLGSSSIQF